ncbi:MAG: 1-deoxy-D-xylulose-5-phosphate reductoisomerase [Mariniblastus sp.]|nr:1-deoxy-D-xylulose-5-phosphate reductoisomerase [Mariniblastus sp.]
MRPLKNIAVLGSTGSIGRNGLTVIGELPELNLFGLSGHQRVDSLIQQAEEYRPSVVVCSDQERAGQYRFPELAGVRFQTGNQPLVELAQHPEVDTVLAAIVGRAGLESTWSAIEAGKTVALANKETLVMAGSRVMQMASQTGARILPVDSEHSAIFQAMQSGRAGEVRRVLLTASGGPFRDFDSEQLQSVTVEQALSHPTWKMGKKITVDSATMMNKALEIIEARWLFGLEPDQIDVIIHPQSIVHSLVEFKDSSVVAQMGPPDMKLPIQYALTYPERVAGPAPRLNFQEGICLEMEPADLDRFPALQLGFEVATVGGTSGAVLNAANESAVSAFLEKKISFCNIVTACRDVLNQHEFESDPSLEKLVSMDVWARKEISKWIA